MTELQPLKFTDSVNNIEFRVQGDTAPQEIIRLDSKGFHYRGQLIEDAGEAHRLMVEFLKQSTQSQPEPVGPTLDDVVELCAEHEFMLGVDGANEEESAKGLLEIARAVLARWGAPANEPVPVSERLPGPEACDAEGRCWIFMPDIGTDPSWQLTDPRDIGPYHTHFLPHHALPTPEATNG